MTLRPAKLRRRLGLEWLGVAVIATAVIIALIRWDGLVRFDNLLYDQLSSVNRAPPAPDILIVAIDEDSLSAFGKWPWPRSRHADLLNEIADSGTAAIAYDILLSEHGDLDEDEALAAAIALNRNLYLPLHFVFPGSNGAPFDVKEPVAQLKGAASGLGHVNLMVDDDGIVRRTRLCFRDPGTPRVWPHIMEQVYRSITDQPSRAFEGLSDCADSRLVSYAPRGSFSTISFAAVANGEVPSAFLRGKTVLVGATAKGLGDQHPVPLSDGGTLAGVEIMANIFSNLRADGFTAPIADWQRLALSLLPAWLLLLGFWRLRPRATMLVSFGLIVATLLISIMLLNFQFWFPPAAALAGLALIYPIWGWRRLQATSDFMDAELETFRASKVDIPVVTPPLGPVDVVTGQAEELTHAISHMRDLRRFITDALSNLPDPMFITDLDSKVKFANKLAQTGIEDGAQDLALDDMLKRFVAPGDLASVQRYLSGDFESSGQDYIDFKSLRQQVFAMRRGPVVSDQGDLRGHIHYLADITDVANATAEREEILQLLSHDMRAPQAAILALIDGRETIGGSGESDSNRRIAQHARRTLALADNFVDLARINSSAFAGQELLLSELVNEAADSLWPLAKARGIKVNVDDASSDAFILGEPSSLFRSFVNLIDNAIKYSPDNGVVEINLRRIDLDRNPHVSLGISDQGEGISDDMKDRLFERFASDDTGSKGSVKGSGLGLNFVAAVIERHNGSIEAENIRDGGARFTVLLPVAPDPAN